MFTLSFVDRCSPQKQKQTFARVIGNRLYTDLSNAIVLIAQFNAKHQPMVPAQMYSFDLSINYFLLSPSLRCEANQKKTTATYIFNFSS
jgi:hypothetical protein